MLLGSSVSLFQCKCGYDLRGLTGDRCPECGITVIRIKPMQPYLLSGVLWGFGVLAVPTLLISGMMIVGGLLDGGSPEMPGGVWRSASVGSCSRWAWGSREGPV